ncbi:hydrogenase expression/formation protein HypE [Crossiella equi]|uniref:Hydrogenase expression/formation protein HypE n=1 Tax=Crossiella equi TaxID=130796 RepID=A0ABS5AP67_9PSEU|nr:hydrogenase expression/formation protein HypE [Crossiella equi]MBP2478373.1 hydrogenase expression/formation protein HypE [Crossiella equi]
MILVPGADNGPDYRRLVEEAVRTELNLPAPPQDAAVVPYDFGPAALTVDTYVATPLFFPGGDIGSLAVYGAVNNLAMRGARPVALGLSYAVAEGFPVADLRRVSASVAAAALDVGAPVVTGDTKVLPEGALDGLHVTTTALGAAMSAAPPTAGRGLPGDVVVLSGPVGAHGAAMLTARDPLGLASEVRSDSRPLHRLVTAMTEAGDSGLHALRDPGRGGLAGALTSLAASAGVGLELYQAAVPVAPEVAAAAEAFDVDPWLLPSAGCLVALVHPRVAERVVLAMRGQLAGVDATVIGSVTPGPPGQVAAWGTGSEPRLITSPRAAVPSRLF